MNLVCKYDYLYLMAFKNIYCYESGEYESSQMAKDASRHWMDINTRDGIYTEGENSYEAFPVVLVAGPHWIYIIVLRILGGG